MTIYIILFFWLLINAYKNKQSSQQYIIICIILLFIGCFRDINVGTDLSLYYDNFKHITFDPGTWNYVTIFEPGFNYIMAFFKEYISSSYTFFYGCIFFMTSITIFFVFKKMTTRPTLTIFFYYSLTLYTYSFNIMRQFLATSIALLFIYLHLQKKINLFIYCILIFFLSYLVHTTTLIFLLFPIFLYISKFSVPSKYLYILLICSYVLFFFSTSLIPYLGNLQNILSMRYYGYVEAGINNINVISPLENLLYTLLAIACIRIDTNKTYSSLAYMFISAVILRNCFITLVPIIARVFDSLLVLSTIYISNVYFSSYIKGKNKLLCLFILFCMIIFFYKRLIIGNSGEVIPYNNILI